MRIQTHRRISHTLTLDDDIDLELQFAPRDGDDPLVERVGDKIVVAYLVHDDTPSNPLTEFDGQGDLYTRSARTGHVITDNDSEVYSALGLDGYGDVAIDSGFYLNGERVTLKELAMRQYEAENPEFDLLDNDVFDEAESDIDDLAVRLYVKHWQAIAGPYVVPISYFSERGGTSIYPTTWDGDTDDLPDGVWVGDKDVIANIEPAVMAEGYEVGQVKGDDGKYTPEYALTYQGQEIHRGTLGACWTLARERHPVGPADFVRHATKYAEGVVKEYASWCEGDVWGCVVEVFERQDDDTWESLPDGAVDSCWGFIGSEYAEKALKDEFFDPTVKDLKEVEHA